MLHHEFRTIEAFVQRLEKMEALERELMKEQDNGGPRSLLSFRNGYATALEHVLQIVRNSNLGIVYPPSEDK